MLGDMGKGLLEAALDPAVHTAGRVSGDAHTCLLAMSWRSLDTPRIDGDDVATYWEGHDTLALLLTGSTDSAAQKRVTRAIGELISRGLIRRVGKTPGKRTRYRLTLGAWGTGGLL